MESEVLWPAHVNILITAWTNTDRLLQPSRTHKYMQLRDLSPFVPRMNYSIT